MHTKLFPIMYTEAAKTATEAIGQGVAAFSHMEAGTQGTVVLVSVDRVISIFDGLLGQGWNPEDIEPSSATGQYAYKMLGRRAIVGTVDFSSGEYDELWDVNYSAGVASYGPLAYQIAMHEIDQNWLMSDESLKPASQKVWQKMFELSNKGVYQRRWLGKWGAGPLSDRLAIGPGRQDLRDYEDGIDYGDVEETDEAYFLEWLEERELQPNTYGWLWAYRTTSHDPKIEDLFLKGKDLENVLIERYGFSEEEIAKIFVESGSKFFNRLYGGKASY